ncbi:MULTISPECIES: hypothetical protein [unclassified Luteococcus]|uniref:hypothetical protein n=1 Tax=unclassified Luteococcus TaxID=2639923 RepID=UPI00313C9EBA
MSTIAIAAVLVGVTLAYLALMAALVGRSSHDPALCPECGRMGRPLPDDETVRHCPRCPSVWIQRKDRA